jgi:dipeptidyl aminopeptidase/acylaminoacyl peptidase
MFHCLSCRCPVFIVHGKEDLVVPLEHGMYLYEAIPDESKATPFWVDKMGHNHYSRQVGRELSERINQFLDFHVLARRLWMLPTSSDDEYTPRPRRMLSV